MKKQKRIKKPRRNSLYSIHLFQALKTQIEGYGFNYSFSGFLKNMLLFLGGMVLMGYFYRLQPHYIVILAVSAFLMMPVLIKNQFKYIYEQNRFNELTTYLEQMAYSFKKTPKILDALRDTYEITTGKIHEDIRYAIDVIDSRGDEYKEAFRYLEDDYMCSRILSLHKFMIKIEQTGGEYQNSMDILIDDISGWSKRTYLFQKDRADIKRKIMISLIISLSICASTLFMIPADMDFTPSPVYQISTLAALLLFLGIYTFVQAKLNGSWLENDAVKNEALILRDYDKVHMVIDEKTMKKTKKKMLVCVPLVFAGIMTQSIPIVILSLFLMYFLYIQPKNKIKFARKRTIREIEKEIPGWCREIALNLQTENVYMAIVSTYDECTPVLRKPLQQLIMDIDENPMSVVPYTKFLEEFNIPEIGRMMKTLYSLTEYGVQNAEDQINKIITQNNAMLAKAETLKNEDALAGVGFLTLAPMFFGAIKMMVDMFLLVGAFMSLT